MLPIRKRNHSETAGGGGGAEGGESQGIRKFKKPRTHTRKGYPKNQTPQDEPKVDSIGVLRNRIRDLKRLLSHLDNDADSKMPANIRIDRERELETCEHELAEKQQEAREADFRHKIIGRYHHIRFFERQKATRTIKRLRKQHAALADDDHAEKTRLRQALQNAEVDLNYTTYYPLLKPYVSLYPRAKKEQKASKEDHQAATAEIDGPKGNLEMWRAVEDAMEMGTLEALRHSREGVTIPGPKDPVPEARKTKKDYLREERERKRGARFARLADAGNDQEEDEKEEVEEEDSDGGFFE